MFTSPGPFTRRNRQGGLAIPSLSVRRAGVIAIILALLARDAQPITARDGLPITLRSP